MGTVPNPATFVSGAVLTAAQLNTNLRDAINFFVAPPRAFLRATAAQSVATSTVTALLFDTEDSDNGNNHSTVTNTSRFTATTPGWYGFGAQVTYTATANGIRMIGVRKNGLATELTFKVQVLGTGTGAGCSIATNGVMYLNGTTDYLEVVLYQDSGVSILTRVADDGVPGSNSHFACWWTGT